MPAAKKLLAKLSIAILIVVVLPVLGAGIFILHSFNPIELILPLLSSVLLVGVFIYFLKPIEKIVEGSQFFKKGEFSHRINIKSNDELEDIASELNQMAEKLEGHSNKISDEKQTLSSGKDKLNLIFSSIEDGIIALDMHCQVVLANPTAEKLTGYTTLEMVGKKIDDLISLSDRGGQIVDPKLYCPIKLTDKDSATPYNSSDSLVVTGKDKAVHNAKVVASPIDDKSSDLGCIIVLHDMTASKELEAIQLDFVSMASHELRTPLTSVTGYLSIFLKENEGKLDAHQKDFLNRILIAAQQLGSIINNLLNVSKVERGAFSMNNAKIDWKEMLEKLVQGSQLQAAQKGINLSLKIDDPILPPISGDEVRLPEVVNNLISNAINYTNSGGSIEVTCKKEGSELVTCIKDTGIGIPKEAIPHIFSKFFRVSGALDKSSNSKGTGLGLYISKSIIDLHHGKIWVESEVNKGSSFCFTLPIKS
jgi:PAS domain S-box-containing protein